MFFLLFCRFVTGIEFREGTLLLDQKHNQKIKKGNLIFFFFFALYFE